MRGFKLRGYAVEEMVGSQWMYGTGVHITEFTEEFATETGKKEEVFIWTDSGWVEVYRGSMGQYIGMKDMNGVEIYEKDLVEHDAETNGIYDTYEAAEIVYDETYSMYCLAWDAPNLLDYYKNLNVVGNTYESKK